MKDSEKIDLDFSDNWADEDWKEIELDSRILTNIESDVVAEGEVRVRNERDEHQALMIDFDSFEEIDLLGVDSMEKLTAEESFQQRAIKSEPGECPSRKAITPISIPDAKKEKVDEHVKPKMPRKMIQLPGSEKERIEEENTLKTINNKEAKNVEHRNRIIENRDVYDKSIEKNESHYQVIPSALTRVLRSRELLWNDPINSGAGRLVEAGQLREKGKIAKLFKTKRR